MLTFHKSCVKQNGTERTANAIAKYFAFFFYKSCNTVISNIKLPFTVDFFLYTCKDFSNDGEMPKANGLQVDIYICEIKCTVDTEKIILRYYEIEQT